MESKKMQLNAKIDRNIMNQFKRIIKQQGFLIPKGIENALSDYCKKNKGVPKDYEKVI